LRTIDPKRAPESVKDWLAGVVPTIDAELERRLADGGTEDPGRLREAMRYAVLGPGKRLRPALVLAACECCGADPEAALPAAAAVEMLHAYTLVHDDLPALDDDELRRGRPTVHIEFGEATAILVGDALLTAAFGALADLGAGAGPAVAVLAQRAGAMELIGGQARDLELEDTPSSSLDLDALEVVHAGKTGALFAASAELGAIAAGADADARRRMAQYGMAIGVAFQHADDADDDEFAALADAARARRDELCAEAAALAESFGDRGVVLARLARWIGRS
jgi:geranylgeranyl pyrophosphate synthase